MAAVQIAQSLGQTVPLLSWFKAVNDTVTEPYLDEVFHVRQAQAYCNGAFDVWDPKITTPPGLYFVSYIVSLFAGCSLTILRAQNAYALVLISTIIVRLYTARKAEDEPWISSSTLSILLFPPLFFFSALYYTDVMSTLSVLVFYWMFLDAEYQRRPIWLSGPLMVVLGSVSLLFRQTNIFWVAVFPAAITLVHRIDRGQSVAKDSMHRRANGFGDSFMSIARTSYKMEVVYDLPVRDAWVEDYAKTIVSLAACTAGTVMRPKHLNKFLESLSPYIILLGVFMAFIIWNGSVVLGDKSNHVATLHLPQMLYIWPFITFFSWPIVYPYLFTIPFWLFAKLPSIAPLEVTLIFKRRQLLPRVWVTAFCTLFACTVVHFNTIVHPFTLADNRHYTFYIFRLLLRPYWVKYAVTPIYIFCGWACIQALGARHPPASESETSSTASTSTDSKTPEKEKTDPARSDDQQNPALVLPNGTLPAKTSFVLIWLSTSALQLVTAPLVEPRYFILPWVFWRLHLPLQRKDLLQPSLSAENQEDDGSWKELAKTLDHRMVLEIVWSLAVNAATGYIFLMWGFSWPQEQGRVQRFMW